MRRSSLAAAAAIAVLMLAGCGDDGEKGSAGGATATATATTAAAPTTTTPAPYGGANPTKRDRIANCLTSLGYKLTGGQTGDSDPGTADYQIVFDRSGGGGYLGFYKTVARAERAVKQLRRNATKFKGAGAERRGAINIVWIDLPDQAARTSVRACLSD